MGKLNTGILNIGRVAILPFFLRKCIGIAQISASSAPYNKSNNYELKRNCAPRRFGFPPAFSTQWRFYRGGSPDRSFALAVDSRVHPSIRAYVHPSFLPLYGPGSVNFLYHFTASLFRFAVLPFLPFPLPGLLFTMFCHFSALSAFIFPPVITALYTILDLPIYPVPLGLLPGAQFRHLATLAASTFFAILPFRPFRRGYHFTILAHAGFTAFYHFAALAALIFLAI